MMSKRSLIRSQPTNKNIKPDCFKILADLGKPTRRGVRKCPNCSFLNGTRNNMCKNPLCNMLFKDPDKRKVQLDCVKLITGTMRQIYSVRVQEKGPEDRGFVQLPFYGNQEKNVLSEVALCFVDSCQRLFDDSILKCHESEVTTTATICVHIESALKSLHMATSLEFKHDLINNLNVEDDVKKKLCSLAKSTDGPIVQRVSKSVMAVKCMVTPTNPLGYLHLNLYSSKGDGLEDVDLVYCSCMDSFSQVKESRSDIAKCIHYYACICAFASDSRFSNKFTNLIQLDMDTLLLPSYDFNLVNMLNADIIEENEPILAKDTVLEFAQDEDLPTQDKHRQDFLFESEKLEVLNLPYLNNKPPKLVKAKKIESKKKRKLDVDMNYFDVLSFNEFLPSITEAINSVIQYADDGRPAPLVFHIPNKFFELLKDRICYGTKTMIKTIQKNTAPMGTYQQTIFHITNMEQLKEIFNTAKVALCVTKYFVENPSGKFMECGNKEEGFSSKAQFITHLKVGNGDAFIIEWIGDLYKVSKFGELKIIFQYGHRVIK